MSPLNIPPCGKHSSACAPPMCVLGSQHDLGWLTHVYATNPFELIAIPDASVWCTGAAEPRLPPSHPVAILSRNRAGMVSALEPPPWLIKVPFCKRGHRRLSLRRTQRVTAQARDPISAAIHTELPALGNSDKENL